MKGINFLPGSRQCSRHGAQCGVKEGGWCNLRVFCWQTAMGWNSGITPYLAVCAQTHSPKAAVSTFTEWVMDGHYPLTGFDLLLNL